MSTESWLLILLFGNVLTGCVMYHFGRGIGIEQQKIWHRNKRKAKGRAKSMARHPAGKQRKKLVLVPEE